MSFNLTSLATIGNGTQVVILQPGGPSIVIDCSEKEQHSRASPPTKIEIENGQTISDHQLVEPFKLKITGIISDSPLNLEALGLGAIGSVLTAGSQRINPAAGVVGAAAGAGLTSALAGTGRRSVANYSQLLQMQSARNPVTVQTTLANYHNMFITDISVPRDAKSANWLEFDIEFEQLLLVQAKTVNIQIFSNPSVASAQANVGNQSASASIAEAGWRAGKSTEAAGATAIGVR